MTPGRAETEDIRQKLPCVRFSAPRDFFRSPLRHDASPARSTFRSKVDDVVGRLDDVEVVLDDYNRVALIDKLVQHVEQLVGVLEMQAGRRLVENVERRAGAPPRQLLRELDPLRLAPAQRRRRLAELDVAEPDVLESAELPGDRREILQQRQRLIDGQVEDVGDRLAAILDLQRFAVVAPPLALLAGHVDVGQEVHLDRDDAVPLAGLAPATLHVEREPPRLEAARLWLPGSIANSSRMKVKRPV